MLTKISITNFKSFRRAEVDLGEMNLLVGANASGKSNFLDALRVLQGIGNGFTVSEILDGKPKSSTSEVWEGIRGGSSKARHLGGDDGDTFEIGASGRTAASSSWRYSIAISPGTGRIVRESLDATAVDIYQSVEPWDITQPGIRVHAYRGEVGRPPSLDFDRTRPVLRQFIERAGVEPERQQIASQIADQLADMQRFDPDPSVLRGYSQARRVERMGEHGDNFAALVATICEKDEAKIRYRDWLRELRPEEVEEVGTLTGAVGEPLFMLRESGHEFPAPVLSDGTLRFAAVVAAFFQPDIPGVMTIEELEKGIHPHRTRLLTELVRRQSAEDGPQVVATTHSPAVLSWLRPEEYHTTFFCRRDPDTGEGRIQPVSSFANFDEAIRTSSVADLFTEGWMEAAS